jgi:hypothetical protein
MPFKRINKCVYKTTKTGKKKEKKGCSDTVPMAKKYLKALYANANDVSEEVDDYLNEIALTEARFKDVKAKYSQYMELVDSARDYIKGKLGDKGVSKYILYVMKETHRMMGEPETKMKVLDAGKDDIIAVMFDLIDLVEKFEKNVARLKEKDIYKLNANELEKLVDDLPTPESEEKRKKRKKAQEESDVLYNEDDVLAVRPLTEFAATYYGMATRWCISATNCRNYFDQYTADGKAFAMVILRNLTPDDSDFYKAALVYDSDGEFESLFDGPDDEHYDTNELRDAIALNHKRTGQNPFNDLDDEEQEEINDILNQIMGNASANIMDNPPDATEAYEAAAERIEEDYRDQIQNAHYYHEVIDGGQLYYSGGFDVSIETSRFDEPEHMKYLNYKEESEIADDIRSMLDRELSVYVNEVNIESGDNETDFRIDIYAEGEATPDGYERFLEELAEYDSKYKGIVRVVELVLQKYDILPKGQLESFDEAAFERETENFSVIDRREYPGDEEIVLRSDREPIGMLLTPEQLQDLNFSTPYRTGSGRTYGYFNKSLSDRIAGKLSAINQKIAASLRKQLPLPGIPQEKIKELTIPEMLEVRIAGGGVSPGNSGEIKLVFQITVDDVKITKENFTMVLDIIKFIDQNYSEMVKVAKNTIKIFITQGLKARDAVDKEKAAAEKLAKIDSQDGTDPVNEYFSELIKTDLERRIQKMTIKEWMDPECPAPWDKDYEDKK